MNKIALDFQKDLLTLLVEYFSGSQISEFEGQLLNYNREASDGLNGLSEEDRMQLGMEISFSKDRYQIDKIVTLAKNKLDDDNYFNLLTKLSEICVSHGKLNFANELIDKIKRECKVKEITSNSLLILSDLYSRKAKWQKSMFTAQRASKIFEKSNDFSGMAKSENIIGTILGDQGKLDEAKNHFERSLELLKPDTDKHIIAMLRVNLGIIHNIIGEYEKAEQYFTSSLGMLETLKDIRRIAEVRYNMGMMHKEQRYYHSALKEFDKAIKIAKENNFMPILSISYLTKAEIFINLREFEFALAFANKAMDLSHEIDDKLTIAEVYKLKGIIERERDNFKLSENYFLSALRINQKLGIQLNIAECSLEIADLYHLMSQRKQEKEFLQESLKYYKKIKARDNIKILEKRLSDLVISN